MTSFYMNGYYWTVQTVNPFDPVLIDRTGKRSVATTDGLMKTVYLSSDLTGEFRTTVLIHEMGHVAMYSFDLMDEIHRMVYPEHWIEAEEWVCNFIADYGRMIFDAVYKVVGRKGLLYLPKEIEKFVA